MLTPAPQCLRDLGWTRVVSAVAEHCATEAGRLAASDLPLLGDRDAITGELARVADLMTLLAQDAWLPLDELSDIRETVARCQRGAVAGPEALIAVAATARAIGRVARHLRHHAETAPQLVELGEQLPDLSALASELAQTFDASGAIRDDASPELAAARRRSVQLHVEIKQRLDRYLARKSLQEVFQDVYYTLREGRYVVPIIASFQSQVPGIIHGTSNTGQTVYLEPTEFLELNNGIKVAQAQIEACELQILRERSMWVGEEAAGLRSGVAQLIALDLLQARARLARVLDAHVPQLADDGRLALRNARNVHLLLKGTDVVANDIVLEADQSFLVITGPNTGGKTVALSTVGTCALMLAAGLPIPADPTSVMTPPTQLWTLFGDPQDIEKDLSTFSGHLREINVLLDAAAPGALVLLDEIIVGTEPTQGAALAMAVLESLAARGARGFVTTHYERLKTIAFEDPRFANAAVGIDPETLGPNFRLTLGQVGASSPFEIASRLGLPQAILDRARAIAGGHGGLAEALARLNAARAEAEAARDAAAAEARRLELARHRLDAERERLDAEAAAEIAERFEDAREVAQQALAALSQQVAEIQRVNDPRELARRRETVLDVLDDLEDAGEALADGAPEAAAAEPAAPQDGGDLRPAEVEPGLRVWVRDLDKAGEVVELRGRKALVAVGAFRTTVPLARLGRLVGAGSRPARPRPPSPAKPAPTPHGDGPSPQDDDPTVPPPQLPDNTVDLRGCRRDEVAERVEPLLDKALRAESRAVWIIHGHGSGAIKQEVRALVRRSRYVSGWRPGRKHEGGDGVTLAWLNA